MTACRGSDVRAAHRLGAGPCPRVQDHGRGRILEPVWRVALCRRSRDLFDRAQRGRGLPRAERRGQELHAEVLAAPASSAGRVTIDGVDMGDNPTAVRRTSAFFPRTLRCTRRCGSPTSSASSRVCAGCPIRPLRPLPDVLKKTNPTDVADRVIDDLSHGYRRVGIAVAIIHGPKLVILDEPISGLDPVQIVEIRSVIWGSAKAPCWSAPTSSRNLPDRGPDLVLNRDVWSRRERSGLPRDSHRRLCGHDPSRRARRD